jgi:AcrR family transcriptional regulator
VNEGDRRGVDRLTIQEAARRLGISEGAVRKRVTRDTLEHHQDEEGRFYVYLDAGVDEGIDRRVDPNSNALISRLENEVAFLRDQVRRQQEIIAQQAVTMRQLTAAPSDRPPDERESAETVVEEPERAEPRPASGEAQEGVKRPWWRRMFRN